MDIDKYLKRINFDGKIRKDDDTLMQLHEHHIFHVPFENLDIHYRRQFGLELDNVYKKVVVHSRGGFCYELNSLFNALLCEIGFKSRILSARVIDDSGNLGPAYDHMVVLIETGKRRYLGDVGFGDLFTRPLEIKDGIQSDGRNLFKIEKLINQDFVLSMSSDRLNFQKKYMFDLSEVGVASFRGICLDKQTNPSSYFVKNIVCTKPTIAGRLTLLNNTLIEKKDDERVEKLIRNDDELRSELKTRFGVVIK